MRLIVVGIFFLSSFFSLAKDPAEEIAEVEERLLKMAPAINDLAKSMSERGLEALVERYYSGAAVNEPKKLGDPEVEEKFPRWKSRQLEWKMPKNEGRTFKKGERVPFAWLSDLLPATGKVKIKTYNGAMVPFQNTFIFQTHHRIIFSSKPGEAMGEVTAEVTFDWGSDGNQLLIIRSKLLSVKATLSESKKPLLASEVLREVIPNDDLYEELRRCRHQEFLRPMFQSPMDLRLITFPEFPHDYLKDLTLEAGEQHPSVSVVDLNQDGYDDIYVMRRWGENQLLINQRDGTFSEEAGKYGLAVDGHCTCALFLDFDNDGDQDVFIGRTLERSMLMENIEGVFSDVGFKVRGTSLPYLVSSAAAADYDGDGLLDLYLGTYFGHTQARSEGWEERFVEEKDREEYRKRAAENTDLYYDFVAPPNLLLRNVGGCRFEVAKENDQVKIWRATLQPTFSDWDLDGDQDLLVTNDFGPDIMFRNDPGEGRRNFVEVTAEAAPQVHTNYFGMGGSWGDYNGDGQFDLYLSAMFSKAGTRITGRLGEFNLRARQSTLGNFLLAGRNGKLTRTSGSGPGEHRVHQVGWSWGGQFFDPDNDGHLDIYAPTGYFTPPPEYSSEVDF